MDFPEEIFAFLFEEDEGKISHKTLVKNLSEFTTSNPKKTPNLVVESVARWPDVVSRVLKRHQVYIPSVSDMNFDPLNKCPFF